MKALLVLLAFAAGAGAAAGAALLESEPGRAVVQAGPEAVLLGEPGAEARSGPVGGALGAWTLLPTEPPGLPLGPGGCERGLCGLHVVEVRGAEAAVVEGTSGVLLLPAPEAPPETLAASEAASTAAAPAAAARAPRAPSAGAEASGGSSVLGGGALAAAGLGLLLWVLARRPRRRRRW